VRHIEINYTDNGWEILVNGVPSARFDRYQRYARRLLLWLRRLSTVLVLGPAAMLALATAVYLISGHLRLSSNASPNMRTLHLSFDLGPTRHSWMAHCNSHDTRGAPAVGGCMPPKDVAALEARDVRAQLLIFYCGGVWLATERLLKSRRRR